MASFKTSNGVTVNDGDEVELVFLYDGGEHPDRERYGEVVHRGTVRNFKHVEPTYEDDPDFGRIVTGKTSEDRWELLINDPDNPSITAVGIRPENVLVRSDS